MSKASPPSSPQTPFVLKSILKKPPVTPPPTPTASPPTNNTLPAPKIIYVSSSNSNAVYEPVEFQGSDNSLKRSSLHLVIVPTQNQQSESVQEVKENTSALDDPDGQSKSTLRKQTCNSVSISRPLGVEQVEENIPQAHHNVTLTLTESRVKIINESPESERQNYLVDLGQEFTITSNRVSASESPQTLLAKSQNTIEQLQQNLSTQLKPATVEILKNEYSPVLTRSKISIGTTVVDSKFQHQDRTVNRSLENTEQNQDEPDYINISPRNFDNIYDRTEFNLTTPDKSLKAEYKTKKELENSSYRNDYNASTDNQISQNGSCNEQLKPDLPKKSSHFHACATSDSEPSIGNIENTRNDINEVKFKRDTTPHEVLVSTQKVLWIEDRKGYKAENKDSSTEKSFREEEAKGLHNVPSAEEQTEKKPSRISWTTQLIEKLAEEEEKKRNLVKIPPRKPARIVRYPGQKDYNTESTRRQEDNTGNSRTENKATNTNLSYEQNKDNHRRNQDIYGHQGSNFTTHGGKDQSVDHQRRSPGRVLQRVPSFDTETESESDHEQLRQQFYREIAQKDINLATTKVDRPISKPEIPPKNPSLSSDTRFYRNISVENKQPKDVRDKSEPKLSGFRRLLSPGLFSSHRRSLSEDRSKTPQKLKPYKPKNEEVQTPLLKSNRPSPPVPSHYKIHPTSPVVETAFLSNSSAKTKQSNNHSPIRKTPEIPKHLPDTPTKQNQYNSSKLQPRSKSVSPSRVNPSSRGNTIPDTSLVLEERLQSKLQDNYRTPVTKKDPNQFTNRRLDSRYQSLPVTNRSNHTPPKVYHNNYPSTESSSSSPLYQNLKSKYSGSYYSTPQRARNDGISPTYERESQCSIDDVRDSKGSRLSSASSSTTVVSQPASWSPVTVQLDLQAISGSPDIKHLQHLRQLSLQQQVPIPAASPPQIASRPVNKRATAQRVEVPERGNSNSVLRVDTRSSSVQERQRSGRLSAPPVPYHEEKPRRVLSPEPYLRSQTNDAKATPNRLLMPVGATVKITTMPSQIANSINDTKTKERATEPGNSPQKVQNDPALASPSKQYSPGHEQRKLSRQEVELLYWHTQRLREQLAREKMYLGLSRQHYNSSSSLPAQLSPKYLTSSIDATRSSRTPTSPLVRPQPLYSTAVQPQQHQHQQPVYGNIPGYIQRHSGDYGKVVPRSRSVSPGSGSRSSSLPRNVQPNYQQLSPREVSQFIRHSPQRNTIAAIRQASTATPTIYEEGQYNVPMRQHDRTRQPTRTGYHEVPPRSQSAIDFISSSSRDDMRQMNKHNIGSDNMYPPIFKRGSLISNSSAEGPESTPTGTKKAVSFHGSDYDWPTRNGPAPQPPTRPCRSSGDSDVFLPNTPDDYVNLMYDQQGRFVYMPQRAPDKPLPPVPESGNYARLLHPSVARWQQQPHSESESGSEAGEVQRILRGRPEEEWGGDGKSRGPPGSEQSGGGGGGGGCREDEVRRRAARRDDPRRHTLSGDHHAPPGGGTLARSMDLESPLPRGYPPPGSALLFDDDPGIMSEVETSSTGFRRGGKQRSSLPVVRTPSKTLERPLGLVFLQYRSETKRALLPNEITSLDTVKALFVRSFPKQLTMEYLDSPHVKIYIHDSNKDMFYELEDLRSHLREIRDRSVLRLFEATDMNGGVLPGAGVGVMAPPVWDQDQSYFSEPEFDSEYQHQHIHKSKTSSKSSGHQPYYMTHSYPPAGSTGAPATLPRGPLLRAYSPAVGPKAIPQSDRLHTESGYMSSPERGGPRAYPSPYPPGGPSYEDPYYSQYASRSGSITPVIDEEARIRVEHMERQLANLTGLVQKALTQTPTQREFLQVPASSSRDATYRNDKSVSFEKSVSFSDEPPDMNSPKQHSPQHTADTKPTKPAIKSSTLPRMSSQERTERERHKPAPPPKPVSLSPGQYEGRHVYRDLQLTPEMYNQLRGLQKKAKDLRQEVRNLRRMSQAQAHTVRETIRDTFIKIRAMLLAGGEDVWMAGDSEKSRLSREEDAYKQEMLRLEKDLTELESTVEELRGNVINRKTRVNMSDVENMALILSKSSKTVADLKVRFPSLQEGMKSLLSSEMEKVVREEKFLKEEPERLESALRRCKKLTGTLVTLKRLASVQEQRLPPSGTSDARLSPTMGDSDTPITPPAHGKSGTISTRSVMATNIGSGSDSSTRQRPENALDALLDELQTFARPPMAEVGRKGSVDSANPPTAPSSLRRLHSYPSSSDGGSSPPLSRLQVSGETSSKSPATSPKPPVPERNADLLSQLAGRRVPPPPPPRTSSRSPLASPTSPSLPPRGQPQMGVGGGTLLRRGGPGRSSLREPLRQAPDASTSTIDSSQQTFNPASNSSSCESVNSQEGVQGKSSGNSKARQEILEQRHQELLRKQRALQEQYARLQQLQRGGAGGLTVVPPPDLLLKKTGSESNLLAKMGLGHNLTTAAPISGSLTHLAAVAASNQPLRPTSPTPAPQPTTTSKIYETDIL